MKVGSPTTSLLLHPAPLAAVLLLVINDQVLKGLHPGRITGKLSDFAGLFFFPLFLADLGHWASRRPATSLVAPSAILTALVFAAVKLWTPAHDVYALGLSALQWPFRATAAVVRGHAAPPLHPVRMVMDATDLVALLSTAFVVGWVARRRRTEHGERAERASTA